MLEVEVLGRELAPQAPPRAVIERMCVLAVASGGIRDGHLAVQFVDADRIAALNAQYRGKAQPTDVLSFPVDGADPDGIGPCELGDIVICPEHTEDLLEAIVHGALHLVGMDHETDDGEMLAVQEELLSWHGQTEFPRTRPGADAGPDAPRR